MNGGHSNPIEQIDEPKRTRSDEFDSGNGLQQFTPRSRWVHSPGYLNVRLPLFRNLNRFFGRSVMRPLSRNASALASNDTREKSGP